MKKLSVLLFTLTTLLIPSVGWAADNVVDLVLSDELIEGMVVTMLDHNPPNPVAQACANANDTCWLDHVDFSSTGTNLFPTSMITIQMGGALPSAPNVRVSVPTTFYWKTDTCVHDPSCALTTYDEVQSVPVFIRLSVQGGQLCGSLVGIGLPDATPNPAPPPQCANLGFGFSGLFNGFAPAFSGISEDSSKEHVVLRQELQPGNQAPVFDLAAWQDFFNGSFPAPPATDASVFLGKELILDTVHDQFRDAIASIDDVYSASLTEVSWQGSGSTAVVSVHKAVTVDTMAMLSVPCPWGNVPADLDGTVTISLDAQNDRLIADVQASVDVDAAFVFACGLTPAEGGLITDAIITGVADNMDFAPNVSMAGCSTVGPLHFQCPIPLQIKGQLPLPASLGINYIDLDPVSLLADGEGIHLGIDAALSGMVDDEFAVSITDPWFGLHGGCSNRHIGYDGGLLEVKKLTLTFGVDLDPSTTSGWQVESRPYPVRWPFSLDIAPATLPNWATPPADLLATVRTSSGMQSFLIASPPVASQEERSKASQDALNAKIQCMRSMRRFVLAYDPRWDIDPPPGGLVEIRSRDRRMLYGYGMLVELTLNVARDGAWLNGKVLVDVGNKEPDAVEFRRHALSADEIQGRDVEEIKGMIEEKGFSTLIKLSPELMGVDDAVAVLTVGGAPR